MNEFIDWSISFLNGGPQFCRNYSFSGIKLDFRLDDETELIWLRGRSAWKHHFIIQMFSNDSYKRRRKDF